MQITTSVFTSLALGGVLFAQCGTAKTECTSVTSGEKNIVQVAVDAGKFTTLAKALQAAGLVDALQGEGPFTVFAPVDSAFAELGDAKIAKLLKKKNLGKLKSILTYHVVPGRLMAADVLAKKKLTTLQGSTLMVAQNEKGVRIGNARILKTDITASNGVIHVIDGVLVPETGHAKSIVGVAKKAGKFGTLLAAAKAAGLADVLDRQGPFTIFAPTDAAFSKIDQATIQSLLQPENREKLAAILKLHVVSGKVTAREAVVSGSAKSLHGQALEFGIRDGRLTVNDAGIIGTDVQAKNGIVHVIDTVLMPSAAN